jgi:hypothetical protein
VSDAQFSRWLPAAGTVALASRRDPRLFVNAAHFRSSTVLIMKRKPTKAGQISPTLVCAWCQNIMKLGAPKISHGICRDCTARFFGKFRSFPVAP